MARIAVADGVRVMVATPHMMWDGVFRNRAPEVLDLVEEANRRFAEGKIDLQVVAGGELYLSPETPRGVASGELLTYGNQRQFVLVEWSMSELPPYVEQLLFDLQLNQVTPVVAHPERYAYLFDEMEMLAGWVERGVLLQVNARSLLGESGEKIRRAAETLVQSRMAHFLGSDAHSSERRPPGLSAAAKRVRELVGDEIAGVLTSENPRRLLAGEEIVTWKPAPPPARRGLLSRWFGRKRA